MVKELEKREEIRFSSYPLKGVWFFVKNPSLWCYALIPLMLVTVFGLVAIGLIFGLALVPQANALNEHLPEWAGWLIAVILCLVENAVVIFIFFKFFFSYFQGKVLEKTMRMKGITFEDELGCFDGCVLEIMKAILFLIVFIITFPLNFVPIIGTVAFCLINGWGLSWELLGDYFVSKKMTFYQQMVVMIHNAGKLTIFGGACMFVQLIPVLNVLSFFTNVVAAGLLACDIEEQKIVFKNLSPKSELELNEEEEKEEKETQVKRIFLVLYRMVK